MASCRFGTLLWTVGLLGYPFRDRVRAAAEHGYHAMSANAWELEEVLNRTGVRGLREMRRYADDHGVRLEVLEPVMAWLPPTALATLRRVELDKIETIGVEMGIGSMLAIANRGTGRLIHAVW